MKPHSKPQFLDARPIFRDFSTISSREFERSIRDWLAHGSLSSSHVRTGSSCQTPILLISICKPQQRNHVRYGFEPIFPQVPQQLAELKAHPPQIAANGDIRDLRNLLWSSIDNDTSRDLDQIEVAERVSNGDVKIMIGISDVDAFVPKSSPIDQHAAKETTTVYAGVRNFPMLPEELSTGKSSLLENQDCLSVVTEFVVDSSGVVKSSSVYRALVRNKAQLQYNSVGAWLEGKSPHRRKSPPLRTCCA
jgi:exoribonuclease-2